jgi:fumarate hydratase subunit beta
MRDINLTSLFSAEKRKLFKELKTGDCIELSGVIYTARDAAHKRMMSMLKNNKELPFKLADALIYYAGPTPAKNGLPIGSCGPTTSSRMDVFTPELIKLGLLATIGKGERSRKVINACREFSSVYFCAIGGAGALAAKCITECEVIAFDDLGCESVKKLTFKNFPLTVAIDTNGNDLFKRSE